jgi:membrane protease YdiL (CAAX protease family)
MQPLSIRLSRRNLLLLILGQVFALMAQAWLSRTLQAQGYEQSLAHYLAYLVVPPILLLVLAPLLLEHRDFLARLFTRNALTIRTLLAAVALGVAARIAWWSQLIARVSFGITANDDPQALAGPVFAWACPPLPALLLGLFVMAFLIPIMEETVHRGFLQSAFVHRGALPAILVSSLVFTVFHPPSSYGFVFTLGLMLGAQFWLTGSLWATMITHATYNGLIQFDWHCLQGRWNPPADSLPLLFPGITAVVTLVLAGLGIVALLHYQRAGAQTAPAPAANPARSRRAR